MSPITTEAAATATPNRTAINHANARLSTGPKTPECKERTRLNAVKHGLYSRNVVLPEEDLAAYQLLGQHLTARWSPATDRERELVLDIQDAKWRIQRAVDLEFSLHAIGAEQHTEAIGAQFGEQTPAITRSLARAAAFQANKTTFDRIESRMRRVLDRAERELQAIATTQSPVVTAALEALDALAAKMEAPKMAAPSPTPNASGFVPSKYPAHMPVFTGPLMKEKRRQWLRLNGYKNLI